MARRAVRGIWRAATENGMASRWGTASALCVLWVVLWWGLQWFILPPLPGSVRLIISISVTIGIFWRFGPTGYGVRWLIADWRISRRRRKR